MQLIPQAVPDSSFTTSPFLPGPPEELLLAGRFNKEVNIAFSIINIIMGTAIDTIFVRLKSSSAQMLTRV